MIAPGRPRQSGAPEVADAMAAAPSPSTGTPPAFAARLVPLDPGFYAISLAASTANREPTAGLALPAVHIGAAPQCDRMIEITDGFGRAGSWLGERDDMLFIKIAAGGGAAMVTAYLARDRDNPPLALQIRRVDVPAPAVVLELSGPAIAGIGLDVVAHISGPGDLRFVDAQWIGRIRPGLSIEAFTIRPRNPQAAAAIEYKGLAADGTETAWLGSGLVCGSRGRALPLIGFAVRQKAVAGGSLFDCEYSGYFQSGAIAGPARNGAPCRSALENDPLEGMQLRVTPRPPRPAPS